MNFFSFFFSFFLWARVGRREGIYLLLIGGLG